MGEHKAKGLPMSAMTHAYEQLYDYHKLDILRARIELGGCRNEIIVEDGIEQLRTKTRNFLHTLNQYRFTDDMEQRAAIKEIRTKAVFVCGDARQINKKAADGTTVLMPKATRMAYNVAVLKQYEEMLASIEWLRSALPQGVEV